MLGNMAGYAYELTGAVSRWQPGKLIRLRRWCEYGWSHQEWGLEPFALSLERISGSAASQ